MTTPHDELSALILRHLLAHPDARAQLVERIWQDLTDAQRADLAAVLTAEVKARAPDLVRPHMMYSPDGGGRYVGFAVTLVRAVVKAEMESAGIVAEIRARLVDDREKLLADALVFARGLVLESLTEWFEVRLLEDVDGFAERLRDAFRARLDARKGR